MTKIRLRVLKNGDDAFLIWKIEKPIERCRGFALYRRRNGKEEVLPSYVGFANEKWKRGELRPSTVWPIQKFVWTDYTIKSGDRASYRVVPVTREAGGKLTPQDKMGSDWSPQILLDPQVSKNFACYFNRGIVAAQWVQKMLGAKDVGAEDRDLGKRRAKDLVRARAAKLDKVIGDLKQPRGRNLLAGELRDGLLGLLKRAKEEGLRVHAALFELTDQELLNALGALGRSAYVVLADGAIDKSKKQKTADDNDIPARKRRSSGDENHEARDYLRKQDVDVHNRMTRGKFLAHNKILVVSDRKGKPRWTWTGSTNWTPSGLCTQANNGLLIDDHKLAGRFQAHIEGLALARDDSPASLAELNSTPINQKVGRSDVRVWFTRTNKLADLADARKLIAEAKHGALFLMFQTGAKGSLLEAVMKRQKDSHFYIHGVISSPPSEGGRKKGAGGKRKRKLTPEEAVAKRVAFVHKGERTKYAPDLLLPFAQRGSDHWFAEFVKKNGAHAIVHSKIIVLDPFGKKPIVMTGSHNMGKTASSKNDENLVIVEGDAALTAAYAVNIMSIYDNYRWRYRVAGGSKWKGISDNDIWQKKFLKNTKLELTFWMS